MDKCDKCNPNEETKAEMVEEESFLEVLREDKNLEVLEEVKPVKESKVDPNQVVEACIKQLQALQVNIKRSKRPKYSGKTVVCWCCAEEGLGMKKCPIVQRNKAAYEQMVNQEKVSKDTNECQMFPESCPTVQVYVCPNRYPRVIFGTPEYQLVPECAKTCQSGPIGTSMAPRSDKASSESCPHVPTSAHRHQKDPICSRG